MDAKELKEKIDSVVVKYNEKPKDGEYGVISLMNEINDLIEENGAFHTLKGAENPLIYEMFYLNSILKWNKTYKHKVSLLESYFNEEIYKVSMNQNIFNSLPKSKRENVNKLTLNSYEPTDKSMKDLMSVFCSTDDLRPALMGANYNELGVVSTDAYKMLFLNKKDNKYKKDVTKCVTDYCVKSHKKLGITESQFPNWKSIIPTKDYANLDFVFDVDALFSYLTICLNFGLFYKGGVGERDAVVTFDFIKNNNSDDSIFSFNIEYLLDCLKGLIKLGISEARINYSSPSKAIVFTDAKVIEKDFLNQNLILLMPVMTGDMFKNYYFDFKTNSVVYGKKKYEFPIGIEDKVKKEINTIEYKKVNINITLDELSNYPKIKDKLSKLSDSKLKKSISGGCSTNYNIGSNTYNCKYNIIEVENETNVEKKEFISTIYNIEILNGTFGNQGVSYDVQRKVLEYFGRIKKVEEVKSENKKETPAESKSDLEFLNEMLKTSKNLLDLISDTGNKEDVDYLKKKIETTKNLISLLSIDEKKKFENGGLIAPNGKPSKLTPEQYKLVRTNEFKEWFGDWENDPANASKVVDENGEPLVVLHGTHREFTIFNRSIETYYRGKWELLVENVDVDSETFKKIKQYNEEKGDASPFDEFWFSNINFLTTPTYLLACFLNCKTLYIDKNSSGGQGSYYPNYGDGLKINNVDGENGVDYYVVSNSNQIKLADGTNTTFDGSNPDIRFDGGGFVISEEKGEKFIKKLSELDCDKPLTNFQMNFFGFLDSLKDDCISLGGFWYDSNTTNYGYSKMGRIVLFDIEDFYNEKERTAFIEENYPTSTPLEIQPFDDDNYEFIGIGEASMGGVFRDKRDGSILKLTASPFEVVGTTKILNAQKKDIQYEDNFAEIYSIQNIGKGVFKGTWHYKYYNEREWSGNWFAIRREDITPFNEQEQKEANCVKEIIVNYYSMFDNKNYQPEIFGSYDIYEPNREFQYLLRKRNKYSDGGDTKSNTTFDSNNPDIRFDEGGGVKQAKDISRIPNFENISKGAEYYSTSENVEKKQKSNRWCELLQINKKGIQLNKNEFDEFIELSNELYLEDFDSREPTTYTEFFNRLKIEDGTKYIGQKFGDVFPYLKGGFSTPSKYRLKVKQYNDYLKRLSEDNYTTKAMKQTDLNKIEKNKENINKINYLSEFYIDNTGTIIDFKHNPNIRFADGGEVTQPRDISQIPNFENIYKGAEYYQFSEDVDKAQKSDRWYELMFINQKERQLNKNEFQEFMKLSNELYLEDFADGGSVSTSRFYATKEVSNWNDIPSTWKNINKVNKVNLKLDPNDDKFNSIFKKFLSTDELRPVMMGYNVDENGITCTNAHILAVIPTKENLQKGIFLNGKEIDGKYPNYSAVIPKDGFKSTSIVDTYKLLQYCNVALNYSDKYSFGCNFNTENGVMTFNLKLLTTILETSLKLGYEELYFKFKESNSSVVISNVKEPILGKDIILLLFPISNRGSEFKGTQNLDYDLELTCYFDFTKNEIINKDNSIVDFEMNYGENPVFTKEIISHLKLNIDTKTRLPILDNFLVEDKKIRLVNLDNNTTLLIKDVDAPTGLYYIQNNVAVYSDISIDDYPKKSPFFNDKPKAINKVNISSEYFKWILDVLNSSKGDDDLRPVMTGLNISYDGSELLFASTNGHSLGVIKANENVSFENKNNFNEIINFGKISDLINFKKDSNVVIEFYQEGNFKIITDGFDIVSKVIDGTYPNYYGVIPKNSSNKLTINNKKLIDALSSKEAQSFIKKVPSSKGATYSSLNILGEEKDGQLVISLVQTELYYRSDKEEKVLDSKVIYTDDLIFDNDANIGTTDSCILLMPMERRGTDLFYFNFSLFNKFIKPVNTQSFDLLFNNGTGKPYVVNSNNFDYTQKTSKKEVSKLKEVKAVSLKPKKQIPAESNSDLEYLKGLLSTSKDLLDLISITGNKEDIDYLKEKIKVTKTLISLIE